MRFAVAALVALAATPSIAASLQADFDAAQALLAAGKRAEARAAFTALLARFPATSNGRAVNIVRSRLGGMLVDNGESAAAEPLLIAAVGHFSGTTAADADERHGARYDLARAREARGAYDSAAEDYRSVLAAGYFPAGSASDISLRAALARTLIWSDPAEARRLVDALLALPPEKFGPKGDTLALLQTLRGRIELNNGNPAEARRWFTSATRSAGGAESLRVNVADVRIRGDLAIANYKLGKLDEVQKNMAFSGAGSMVAEGLSLAANTELPKCAPLSELAPDAVAIIEFAIDDEGRAVGVAPIFVDRGSGGRGGKDEGPEALFAGAVRAWSWDAKAVKKLEPFWRQAVRVEVRCFNDRPPGDPVLASLNRDHAAWAMTKAIAAAPDFEGSDATRLPQIRAELARREAIAGATSPQLLPVLAQLFDNVATTDEDRLAAQQRRMTILAAAGAPLATLGEARLAAIAATARAGRTRKAQARLARDGLAPMLGELVAAGTDQSRIGMATRLRLAEAHDDIGDTAAAAMLYKTIVAAPETLLPSADPIRTAALLHIANQAAVSRDTAAAAEALAATGLTAEQCSLIETRPQPVNTTISSAVFPSEAIRWGNGGVVRVGYDITADGRPANVRAIMASPPLIYSAITEKAVAQFQYRPVFRPGNTLGCTGNVQGVKFSVAR